MVRGGYGLPLVAIAGAGAVFEGRYSYMKELVVLDSCRPGPSEVVPDTLRAALAAMRTPLRVAEWGRALRGHPDREFVDYLLDGMSQGFRIGFNQAFGHLKSAKRNMVSASAEPAVIEAYLAKERAAGRVVGPLVPEGDLAASCIHTSRFGVIPKPHQPGKWRLIVDLSHPKGQCERWSRSGFVLSHLRVCRCSRSYGVSGGTWGCWRSLTLLARTGLYRCTRMIGPCSG